MLVRPSQVLVSRLTQAEILPMTTETAATTWSLATMDRQSLTIGAAMWRIRPRQAWSSTPMTARISGGHGQRVVRACHGKRGKLTGLEDDEGLEADLDLGNQGLDADNEREDELEVGLNEGVGVDDEAVELGDAVEEDLEVGLEVDDDLEQGLGVDLGASNDGGWCC
jgi:hypothetical protein